MNKEQPKVLVFGTSGGIGRLVYTNLRDSGRYDVVGTFFNHRDSNLVYCDITDQDSLRRVVGTNQPDFILNFAGLAQEKLCRDNPIEAYHANVQGTEYSVRIASDNRIPYLYPSTINVFTGYTDGERCDEGQVPKAKPESVYSQTKIEAEKIVTESTTDWAIFRTDLVLAQGYGMAKLIENQDFAKITINGPRFPVYGEYYTDAIRAFIDNPQKFSGITHIISPEFKPGFKLANVAKSIISRFNIAPDSFFVENATEFTPRKGPSAAMPIYITPDANKLATQRFLFTSSRR